MSEHRYCGAILNFPAMLAGVMLLGAAATVRAEEPIKPIPLEHGQNAAKVALGELLFNDKRLSKDNTLSCASCHNLQTGGVDRTPVSTGINGAQGPINAPTVFNSGASFRQFWDGRARSLEEQAAGPIQNPLEMGSNLAEVMAKLSVDPAVQAQFAAVYRDGLQPKNMLDAIASFERSLITPNSRFDHFLRGDESAISADELKGYQLFKSYGCTSCHQGVNVGGNMFQVFGVMGNYFADRGRVTEADLGRYNVTRDAADRHVFKVPSLRNVALTAPYFHDGSAKTLEAAVDVMFRYQLGRTASHADKDLLIKFLRTLSGEYKGLPLDPQQTHSK